MIKFIKQELPFEKSLKQAEQRAVKSLKDIRSANIICHYRKRLQQKQLRRIKRMILKLHLYKKFLLKHRKKLCCSLMRSAKNPQNYQLR